MEEDVEGTAYRLYWEYIRSVVSKEGLKKGNEVISEDEFNRERHNINIIFLGKLNCSYKRYNKIKSYYNKVIKEENDSIKKD